jgi:hypothetical protein
VAPDSVPVPAPHTNGVVGGDLSNLFHRLNNQLGIILANAELLEARLSDDTQRTRASLVVSGAMEAISSVQDLRRVLGLRGALER